MFDQRRQNFHRVRPHDEFVMLGADIFRDAPRVMQLTEVLFFETNRECLDLLGRLLGHQRDHRTGIYAAGKKSTQRHFRHQAHPHCIAQQVNHALAGFFFTDRNLTRKIELPVTLELDLAVFPQQRMTGLEFANRLVRSQRRRHTDEREIMMNCFIVYVAAHVRVLKQSHEL